MIIGPGLMPWMIIAAISTAAGAEPGMASVSTGMTAPGTQALSPVSAAIRPSIEPLPNFSFSLLARLAAAYDDQAATSSPTPGHDADAGADQARAQDRAPVLHHVAQLRHHASRTG